MACPEKMAGGFHSPSVPSFNAIDIIMLDDVWKSQKCEEVMTSSHAEFKSVIMLRISAMIQSFTPTATSLRGRLVAATMS